MPSEDSTRLIDSTRLPSMPFRSSKAFIAFVVSYAVFTDQFIFTCIVPIAPAMLENQFHIRRDVAGKNSLLLTTCGVAMLVSSPILGWWSDRSKSRRPLFLLGVLLILGSTVMLWRVTVVQLAYVARIFQGIGSAIVWVMSLAIMFDTVGHARIGEFMGYAGIGMNLGTILGPKIGSVVFNYFGLHGVFAMCLFLIGGDLILRLAMSEKTVPASRNPSLTTTPQPTKTNDIDKATRQEKPLSRRKKASSLARRLPSVITLLYRPRFVCAIWGVFIMAVIGDAFKIALPLHARENFGWDHNKVADAYVALAAPAFFGPVFGHITDRFGRRPVAVLGMLVLGACLLALRAITDSSDHKLLWALLPVIGVAVTVALEPLTADIAYIVTKEDESRSESAKFRNGSYGQGYGLFNTAWSAGNTFGPIWSAHMYEVHSWDALWLALGMTVVATTVPIFLLCGGWWFHGVRKKGV